MFLVRYVNHFFNAPETFATVNDAIAYGRKSGNEFAIDRVDGGGCVCGWSTFGGLKFYDRSAEKAHYARA